jgi:regulator of replication initiation timing
MVDLTLVEASVTELVEAAFPRRAVRVQPQDFSVCVVAFEEVLHRLAACIMGTTTVDGFGPLESKDNTWRQVKDYCRWATVEEAHILGTINPSPTEWLVDKTSVVLRMVGAFSPRFSSVRLLDLGRAVHDLRYSLHQSEVAYAALAEAVAVSATARSPPSTRRPDVLLTLATLDTVSVCPGSGTAALDAAACMQAMERASAQVFACGDVLRDKVGRMEERVVQLSREVDTARAKVRARTRRYAKLRARHSKELRSVRAALSAAQARVAELEEESVDEGSVCVQSAGTQTATGMCVDVEALRALVDGMVKAMQQSFKRAFAPVEAKVTWLRQRVGQCQRRMADLKVHNSICADRRTCKRMEDKKAASRMAELVKRAAGRASDVISDMCATVVEFHKNDGNSVLRDVLGRLTKAVVAIHSHRETDALSFALGPDKSLDAFDAAFSLCRKRFAAEGIMPFRWLETVTDRPDGLGGAPVSGRMAGRLATELTRSMVLLSRLMARARDLSFELPTPVPTPAMPTPAMPTPREPSKKESSSPPSRETLNEFFFKVRGVHVCVTFVCVCACLVRMVSVCLLGLVWCFSAACRPNRSARRRQRAW